MLRIMAALSPSSRAYEHCSRINSLKGTLNCSDYPLAPGAKEKIARWTADVWWRWNLMGGHGEQNILLPEDYVHAIWHALAPT